MPVVVPIYKRQTNSPLAGFNTYLVNLSKQVTVSQLSPLVTFNDGSFFFTVHSFERHSFHSEGSSVSRIGTRLFPHHVFLGSVFFCATDAQEFLNIERRQSYIYSQLITPKLKLRPT